MLYITKIDDYLEILTAKEVKNFVVKHFKETVRKEGNLRKVAKSFYVFLSTQSNSSDNCLHHYNVEILNVLDPELQMINTKPVTINKLKELLSELKSLKFRQY